MGKYGTISNEPRQRHRSLMSASFKDQSNSPPLLSVVAHDGVLKGTTLVYIHYMSDLELAILAGEPDSASMVPVAEVAVHVGMAEPFAVLQAGD
jgi:hypothetical protein